MAFELFAVRDGATYSLSGGTPYKLASATGMAWPPIVRTTVRAPAQDGDVDYGYYLDPRVITLTMHFSATSGSALDSYRDTFNRIFRPDRNAALTTFGEPRFAAQTPIILRAVRDDGAVREIGVYATGPADIVLEPESGAARLHRAVVQLIAPNPAWRGTASIYNSYTSAGGGTPFSVSYAYTGSYYAQPFVQIAGSINGPVLTNVSTGASLSFGTVNLPTAFDVLIVDTVNKRATANGTVVLPTGGLGIPDWRIAPDPQVSGGTNTLQVTAASSGTTATMSITQWPQYVSY